MTDDTWQMTHMTQMTYRWHRHMIVDFFQVMPFQLGCVHCAGVILPAGLFLLFLSLKTDKKQFKPVAKRQEFRLKLVQCCPLISSMPTDKIFLFILIYSFFRFPLYRVERGLDQRMCGAGEEIFFLKYFPLSWNRWVDQLRILKYSPLEIYPLMILKYSSLAWSRWVDQLMPIWPIGPIWPKQDFQISPSLVIYKLMTKRIYKYPRNIYLTFLAGDGAWTV